MKPEAFEAYYLSMSLVGIPRQYSSSSSLLLIHLLYNNLWFPRLPVICCFILRLRTHKIIAHIVQRVNEVMFERYNTCSAICYLLRYGGSKLIGKLLIYFQTFLLDLCESFFDKKRIIFPCNLFLKGSICNIIFKIQFFKLWLFKKKPSLI